ncbi:MAG: cobaltochelatase subunit CobN [Planctomycetia bacterium]|nr:cobaltochelatase subunit CobN [Planctomycetia bacterium]
MSHITPRRAILTVLILLILLSLCARALLRRAISPTQTPVDAQRPDAVAPAFHVALVGFADSDAELWRLGLEHTNVTLSVYHREDYLQAPLEECDAVLLRAIGWIPTDEERAKTQRVLASTLCIGHTQTLDFAREATSSNISEESLKNIAEYLNFPCEENSRRCVATLAQIRAQVRSETLRQLCYLDGARSNEPLLPLEPLKPVNVGFFYYGDQVDETYEAFEARRDAEGRVNSESAPRIALFGDFLDPYKTLDRQPVDELLQKLETAGFNVYPIYKIQNNPELLRECRPDLAIYFPRGRVFADGKASELFAQLNTPVLTAALLSTTERQWRNEPIGSTGSYYSLATALPELDGATDPIAIGVKEPNADGLVLRAPLSERIDALAQRCVNLIELRRKANSDKRVAIFYYKSPGSAALAAQSLEVVPSLYNTLRRLREQGYDLGEEFPESSEALEELLQRRGRTIGAWTLGDLAQFIADAQPELVPAERYLQWFKTYVPEHARRQVIDAWGAPPGDFMTVDTADQFGLIVPRIVLGKIALIPQPTTDVLLERPYQEQDNDFDAVHGTGKAPPHFYLCAYLWARYGFNADAIVHFGTHGSLEFTHGKTGFLTESCFPDVLIGNTPHVYLYSINNIGESILAKRRARATLISHLTPPFIKGGLYGDLETLDEKIHEYEACEEPLLKSELATTISDLVFSCDILEDLVENELFAPYRDPDRLTSARESHELLSEEQLEVLHSLLHRYENAKVTDGLHVIGRPWDAERLEQTVALSRLEPEEAKVRLNASFSQELDSFLAALDASYIPPGTGGDFLLNPDAAPTGRNLVGIDAQRIPTPEAQRVAQRLTDELLSAYQSSHGGAYPRRVACTLWGGETARTQGVGIAQALYLMGVRVTRQSRGTVEEVELIPAEELGRPRIDVIVQTSGQFRDSFSSRIELIDKAARLVAATEENEPFDNYVRLNALAIERRLIEEHGTSPEEARELSSARVFGATNALSYGTGIMTLVERGDLWESDEQVGRRYLANMSGVYRDAQTWGAPTPNLLEYNLEGLDLTVQTRSSNVWGPAKLDHIYEFATLAAAARTLNGVDPEIWFDDLRDPNHARVETARAALREELRSTLWNPVYLAGLKGEGATAAQSLAKTTRNLFGWSVAQPSQIDQSIWEQTCATLVDDSLELGLREWFEQKNPGALQDMTAVMLEAVRKGFWNADQQTVEKLATVHAELVERYGASGSYETTGNRPLQDFIKERIPEKVAASYQAELQRATSAPAQRIVGMTLVEQTEQVQQRTQSKERVGVQRSGAIVMTLVFGLCLILGFFGRRRWFL